MNVTLPDGTVVTNVPEGTTKAELFAKVGMPMPREPAPEKSFGQRFIQGIYDPVVGAGQIADRLLVNPIRQMISPGATSMEDVVKYGAGDIGGPSGTDGFDGARLLGNLANPMSWMGPGRGVQALAGSGAVQGAMQPVEGDNFWTNKAMQVGVGAGVGAALGKVVGPQVRPGVRELQAAGVQPTPGQAYGGFINDIEQKLTSVPVVGDMIQGARGRAAQEFSTAVTEKMTGAKTVREAEEIAQRLYNENADKMVAGEATNASFGQRAQVALDDPKLSAESVNVLRSTLADIGQRINSSPVKQIHTELGELQRNYAKSMTAQDRLLARHFGDIRKAFFDGSFIDNFFSEQGTLPNQAVQQADQIWRNMIPLGKAASRRADELITPRNIEKEVAKQANKVTGRNDPGPLIRAGSDILPNTVPDSGTAGRGLAAGVLFGGLGAINPVAAITAAATTAAYTSRVGSRILTGNAPKWVPEGLRKEALTMSILLQTGLNRDSLER